MPLQNRVQPTGDIIADPSRGTMTGNRGIIHREGQTLSAQRWTHKAWICCELSWQGRKRSLMTGRKWTELFFLDEAVALAAGHRPCGYCRRKKYNLFLDAWERATGLRPKATDIDRVLHAARVETKTRNQIRHDAPISELPDGVMILQDGQAHLIKANALLPYTPAGYERCIARPLRGDATVLTPTATVAVLKFGYQPELHATANL